LEQRRRPFIRNCVDLSAKVSPLLKIVADWRSFLSESSDDEKVKKYGLMKALE
jgi:hypothetical protein